LTGVRKAIGSVLDGLERLVREKLDPREDFANSRRFGGTDLRDKTNQDTVKPRRGAGAKERERQAQLRPG
jgi:hypothetical protein